MGTQCDKKNFRRWRHNAKRFEWFIIYKELLFILKIAPVNCKQDEKPADLSQQITCSLWKNLKMLEAETMVENPRGKNCRGNRICGENERYV